MGKKIKRRSDCPISHALDIFGDSWSLLVIRDLMFRGKRTYGAFLDSEEKIATNILADRLETLTRAGLIRRQRDRTRRSSIIYSLTDKGIDLVPVLLEMVRWSAKHDPRTAAPPEFVSGIRTRREALIREIVSSLGH